MPMLRLSRDFIFILRANDYSSRLDRDTSSPKSTMKTVYVLDSFYFSIYLFFSFASQIRVNQVSD